MEKPLVAAELKQPEGDRAAVITIRDMGEGKIQLALVYAPPLKEDEALTPAQAFAGHAFVQVQDILKALSANQMDADQLITVDAMQSIAAGTRKQPVNHRVEITPQERFKVPSIVPGEKMDLDALKGIKR